MLDLTAPLAPTLSPLLPAAGGSVAEAVRRLGRGGWRAVQLSAAQPGLRPRELDRRGRRDVLSLLGREGVMLAGLDLMIPRRDWLTDDRIDRAVTAATAAIELAADLGRVPLSLPLPVAELADEVKEAMVHAADGRGVALAIHAEDQLETLVAWIDAEDQPSLRAGLDAAAALAVKLDPAEAASRLGSRLAVARLDDYAPPEVMAGSGRCLLGEGELDPAAYQAAVMTAGAVRSVVVELRDLGDPGAGLEAAADHWSGGPLAG